MGVRVPVACGGLALSASLFLHRILVTFGIYTLYNHTGGHTRAAPSARAQRRGLYKYRNRDLGFCLRGAVVFIICISTLCMNTSSTLRHICTYDKSTFGAARENPRCLDRAPLPLIAARGLARLSLTSHTDRAARARHRPRAAAARHRSAALRSAHEPGSTKTACRRHEGGTEAVWGSAKAPGACGAELACAASCR